MFDIKVDLGLRTVRVRATGMVTVEEMRGVRQKALDAYDKMGGADHIVLADLRGMSPMAPDAAAIMGEIIGYGRAHGTVFCVHLSDSSILRLQAARLAREASPQDKITTNVVSLEEAEKLIREAQARLMPRAG